jgi:methionyl-tRNA formyltransferase
MTTEKNVVILGKGALAIKIAEWFRKSYNLVAVIPVMPEPTWTDSLSSWANQNGIPVVTSGHYNDLDNTIRVDVAMSVFYDKIIKPNFINRCKNIINLHNAPLPFYRGVRPINWALKNGEQYHGVTIHKISPGIDDGDILGKVTYPIYPDVEEVEDVYLKALDYGWLLFLDVAKKLDYTLEYARPQMPPFSYYSNKENGMLGNRSGFRRT